MSPWVGKTMDRKDAATRRKRWPAECGGCGALASFGPGQGMCGENGTTITARCGNNLFVPTLIIETAVGEWNRYGRLTGCGKKKRKRKETP